MSLLQKQVSQHYQEFYERQIQRYQGVTLAEFIDMIDLLKQNNFTAEHEYLDAWVELQWAYWNIERRLPERVQREQFDSVAHLSGFVLIG